MRRGSLVLLAFVVGLGAGLSLEVITARAGAAGVVSDNGDTNGDGARDVSDAVYLLNWLFLGGPEPVPFEEGCPPRFLDNGDGTVTDGLTGLMWLQSTADTNGDGLVDLEDMVTKEEAEEFAREHRFAGYDDWELPTTSEMASLMNPTRSPCVDPVFDVEYAHWIGSTNGGDPCHGSNFAAYFEYAWIGLHDNYDSSVTSYVLLVRRP